MAVNGSETVVATTNGHKAGPPKTRIYYVDQHPKVADLEKIIDRTVDESCYPLASTFPNNIVVYEMSRFSGRHDDADLVSSLQDEWSNALAYGPGIAVLKGLYRIDGLEQALDAANGVFDKILEDEHAQFSQGAREDVSEMGYKLDKSLKTANTFTKLAVRDPETFIKYFSNPWL